MIEFINSNFFTSLITFIAGVVAFVVYFKQRNDKKRDVANALLSEIRSAERAIEKVRDYVRDTDRSDANIKVLDHNSWAEYKYMFSGDLDEDQWKEISEFYSNAELLDDIIRQSNAVFEDNAEKIRSNMQRVLADLIELSTVSNEDDDVVRVKLLNQRIDFFDRMYDLKKNDFTYTPVKYVNDTKRVLDDLHAVSITSAGDRVKKLAVRKRFY
jgi:hypothetical protein